MGNNSCKSFNVHRNGNNVKKLCELNNKTRQMKPGDFKRKKGSTYYGSVQVSWNMFLVYTYSFLYSRAAQGEDKETKNLFGNPFLC